MHTVYCWEKLRKRPCERPRWGCSIKIDLKEIESGGRGLDLCDIG